MKKIAIATIVCLALLGAFSGATRAVVVFGVLRGAPANELSPEDRANIEWLAAAIGVDPATRQYEVFVEETRATAARYNALPYATLLHVVPGTAFLLLAPLQLTRRFRLRGARVHHTVGYFLMVLGVSFGATALYLSFREPIFGAAGASATILASLWFLYCGRRAYLAIRVRDVDVHRAWMLRALAMAYAIAVVRAIALALFAVFPVTAQDVGSLTFWSGFLVSALAAEWWVRRPADRQPRALKWAS
jgi:uncharacterized membrane protein